MRPFSPQTHRNSASDGLLRYAVATRLEAPVQVASAIQPAGIDVYLEVRNQGLVVCELVQQERRRTVELFDGFLDDFDDHGHRCGKRPEVVVEQWDDALDALLVLWQTVSELSREKLMPAQLTISFLSESKSLTLMKFGQYTSREGTVFASGNLHADEDVGLVPNDFHVHVSEDIDR